MTSTATKTNSTFKASRFGGAGGAYTCESCGKKTRDTGYGEQEMGYCAFCLLEAELENSLNDGNISQEEYDLDLAKLQKKYKRGPWAKEAKKAPAKKEAAPKAKRSSKKASSAKVDLTNGDIVKAMSEGIAEAAEKEAKKGASDVTSRVLAAMKAADEAATSGNGAPLRASKFSGKTIKKLLKENPRRPGTWGHRGWNLYKDGMTYEQFRAAGGRNNDLQWDLDHGFISMN